MGKRRPCQTGLSSTATVGSVPGGTAAVVLTYRRPRLATDVVRSLVQKEGFEPARVLLVVNGEGGLVDRDLERRIAVLRLRENVGPAGGYRAGLIEAVHRFDPAWIYLNEDDIGMLDLPSPRIDGLLARVAALERAESEADPVGAVVAYGRDLDPRTGLTVARLPRSTELAAVDVAAWGSSLVSRRVVDAGVLPDEGFFFGYEDFDFWLRVRAAGFQVLLDGAAATMVAGQVAGAGRDETLAVDRPLDHEEAWRSYYQARNFLELRRRHGSSGWTRAHLWKSVRRFHIATAPGARMALLHGLGDGFRGRMGKVDRYQRDTGEHD